MLTCQWYFGLIGGLEAPLEHAHVRVDGEALAGVLESNHRVILEQVFVHIRISLNQKQIHEHFFLFWLLLRNLACTCS